MINIYLLIFTISLKGIITYFTEGEKDVVRNISLAFKIQAKAGKRDGVRMDEISREYYELRLFFFFFKEHQKSLETNCNS